MLDYKFFLFFLSIAVDLLLLLAANCLCGYPSKIGRTLCAGILGGIYSVWCMIPDFAFLGSFWWRLIFLGLIGITAFGITLHAIRRITIFIFMSFALSGVMTGIEQGGYMDLLSAAGILVLLCFFGFRGRLGGSGYLPVELSYGDTHLQITALQDTGNTLRDPITGRQVLVIGADVAEKLVGLTPRQLKSPVESIGALPGLRLIPYRTVGENSFMLAIHLPKVKIGQWQGGTLVAFAPNCLSPEGAYQALTGVVI